MPDDGTDPHAALGLFLPLRAALENQRDQIAARLEAVAAAEAAIARVHAVFTADAPQGHAGSPRRGGGRSRPLPPIRPDLR
jgi:hypothetical protein